MGMALKHTATFRVIVLMEPIQQQDMGKGVQALDSASILRVNLYPCLSILFADATDGVEFK